MPRAFTFEDVASIGSGLEGVERTLAWGQPALKVRGKMFVCMAAHRSAEPGSLVVMMDRADRDALIADAPETYYLKEHYVDHPCVLVRLSRVRQDALRDVVVGAYRFVQFSSTRRRPSARSGSRGPRRRE
ncbi:MAG TPA: MmcQ/YjbR family DNA-binding protein [Vicinamibacterales bacterium]|nr:MmcQ/YjbR family DNA-binding protein [Vicinamibacterales bacterium]